MSELEKRFVRFVLPDVQNVISCPSWLTVIPPGLPDWLILCSRCGVSEETSHL